MGRVGWPCLTNSGELGSDVKYHDSGHAQGQDVHEVGGSLKDDGVGKLHTSSVTGRLDAGRTARYGRGRPYQGAQRQQILAAYCLEIPKSHVDLLRNGLLLSSQLDCVSRPD